MVDIHRNTHTHTHTHTHIFVGCSEIHNVYKSLLSYIRHLIIVGDGKKT